MRRTGLPIAFAATFLALAAAAPAASGDADLAAACPTMPMRMAATRQALVTCTAFVARLPPRSAIRADGLAAKGQLQMDVLEDEAALATLNEALAIEPRHLRAGVLKVMTLNRLGRWPETRRDIERLLAAYPQDADVLRANADFVLLTGSAEAALAAYDRALAAAPRDWDLRGQRARVLARLGRVDAALAELDAVVRADPYDVLAFEARAALFLERGDAKAALADIETAKARGAPTDRTNFILARAQLMLGRLEDALVSFAAAGPDVAGTELAPSVPLYRFAILHRLGRTREAAAALDESLGDDGMQLVLRLQVYLRNFGFDDVRVSGKLDEPTKRRLAACFVRPACGGPMSKSI